MVGATSPHWSQRFACYDACRAGAIASGPVLVLLPPDGPGDPSEQLVPDAALLRRYRFERPDDPEVEGARAAFLDLRLVVRDAVGIVAAAAIERHGTAGLLRSVVVRPDARSGGHGRAIVRAAEAAATQAGLTHLLLLTETAAAWFPRLGYAVIRRVEVDAAAPGSPEVTGACAETAVAMRKDLSARA